MLCGLDCGNCRSRDACPAALGLCGLECDRCESRYACPFGLGQIVAGGYTYIDPTSGAIITTQYPTGQGPQEQEATTFLESTSPLFGLQWQWVLMGGLALWLVLRKK